MGIIGRLYALNEKEVQKIKAIPRENGARAKYVGRFISSFCDKSRECDLDQGWKDMSDMVIDGIDEFSEIFPGDCEGLLFYGGEWLCDGPGAWGFGVDDESDDEQYEEDGDYGGMVILKSPERVAKIASALPKSECVYRGAWSVKHDMDDFDYVWGCFEGAREIYQKAAAEKLYVLFTAWG